MSPRTGVECPIGVVKAVRSTSWLATYKGPRRAFLRQSGIRHHRVEGPALDLSGIVIHHARSNQAKTQ